MSAYRLVGFLCLCICAYSTRLFSQVDTATAPDSIPDLHGNWRLTSPLFMAVPLVTLQQTGRELEGAVTLHFQCGRNDVKLELQLAGYVIGRVVTLRGRGGRLQGELGDACTQYSEVTNQTDFVGQLSSDGKRISGPFDHSRSATHIWTFTR
jgi:hypothetical protein